MIGNMLASVTSLFSSMIDGILLLNIAHRSLCVRVLTVSLPNSQKNRLSHCGVGIEIYYQIFMCFQLLAATRPEFDSRSICRQFKLTSFPFSTMGDARLSSHCVHDLKVPLCRVSTLQGVLTPWRLGSSDLMHSCSKGQLHGHIL